MAQVNTDENHRLFSHEQLTHLYTANRQKNVSNIASDEDIMENDYMFIMLWSLSVSSHFYFPTTLCLISGTKSKNNWRGYVVF